MTPNISFCIHNFFSIPKDKFEEYVVPYFQTCGTILRIDYEINHHASGREHMMAFIYFSEINENSENLAKIQDDIQQYEFSNVYIFPRGRFLHVCRNINYDQ